MELNEEKLTEIFKKINKTKIGLYGDFCLDSYWVMDPRGSEISLETGLKAQAVSSQNYSLGGASNVAANVAALKPAELSAFGIYGDDVFGKEMISQLKKLNVNIDDMIIQKENFDTYTFSKLILEGKEQPRIDFGTYNKRTSVSDNIILKSIKNRIENLDIIIINQQVPNSITNLDFITGLNRIIGEYPEKTFIVDSRHFAGKFKGVSFKVNNYEAARLIDNSRAESDDIKDEELKEIAVGIFNNHKRPIFITRGENGILAFDGSNLFETPGINLKGELDIVGAGDTALSAITCALGAGCSIQETIELANLAACVTVQKLYQTGTASQNEIMSFLRGLGK